MISLLNIPEYMKEDLTRFFSSDQPSCKLSMKALTFELLAIVKLNNQPEHNHVYSCVNFSLPHIMQGF